MESTVAAFAAFYANNKDLVFEIGLDADPNSPDISEPDLTAAEERLKTACFTNGKEDQLQVMKQLRQFNASLQADVKKLDNGFSSVVDWDAVHATKINNYITEACSKQNQ